MAVPAIPERVQRAIELIDVQPDDHLLEIGCGGGHAVGLACARLARGSITAIDRSAAQIDRARRAVSDQRAHFVHASLADFQPGRTFGKIFAINVNEFWTSPDAAFADAIRLLEEAGSLHLIFEPPPARLTELRKRVQRLMIDACFAVRADVLGTGIFAVSGERNP